MPRARTNDSEKLRRLEVLARVDRVFNSSLEPERVLNLILREAVHVMHATSGSVALIDPHTQLLEIAVAIGLNKKARRLKLPIGRGVTGWVAKTGKPLRVSDVTVDPRYVSVRRGVHSELAVPLIVPQTRDRLIGVLNVDSTRRDAFRAADEELLVALANHAAQIIHNSWLYAAVAQKATQLEALFGVAQSIISSLDVEEILRRVAREACRLMDSKLSSLMLLNAAGDRLELRACHGASADYTNRPPLSVDNSLLGVVVRRCKTIQVHNVQEHDQFRHTELARKEGLVSLLSVPMISGDKAIGALNVYSAATYRYSDQDTKLLAGLANLAAIAIDNARLHRKAVEVEEQLRQNERLSALGLLAAEIAHEIRNPLTVIKMLFLSLDLKFPADDPRDRDIEVISEKMEQLNHIVDRVLRFAHSAEPTFELVDINDLIADVLLLARHALAHQNVVLKTNFAHNLPKLRADRAQIEQVCLNLILNAAAAMPDGGRLIVATAFQRSSPSGKFTRTPPGSSGRVLLTFQDTGIGISPETQKNLFAPFLTTKARGTGLGLAIVHKIVESHGGAIEVESAPKKGTTFRILLPV
ncbi:MAG: GAF domain-containing protein [Verrucomicrobiia bacterium]